MTKDAEAYRTIGEVADALSLPQHVLRFWEAKFPQIDPLKRGGGRRYYRPDQVALIGRIKDLLYRDGYTIKGVQRLLKERGVKSVRAAAPDLSAARSFVAPQAPAAARAPENVDLTALAEIVEACRTQLANARASAIT